MLQTQSILSSAKVRDRRAIRAATIFFLAASLLLGGGFGVQAQGPTEYDEEPKSSLTAQELAAALKRLGSSRFSEREEATKTLSGAGRAAIAPLERVAAGYDAESARRARELLKRLHLGIDPETPPEIVQLIQELHACGPEEHVRMAKLLEQLCDSRHYDAVLGFFYTRRDDKLVFGLTYQIYVHLRPTIAEALAVDDRRTVRKLLVGFHRTGGNIAATRDYAALLMAGDESEPMIAKLRAIPSAELRREDRRLLATLLMWRDRFAEAEALVAGHAVDFPDLVLELELRTENWSALLARAVPDRGFRNEELPHYRLLFAKLAGDRAAHEKAVSEVRADAQVRPDYQWNCGKSFLVTESRPEAEEMLAAREADYVTYLIDRGEFARAFAVAKLPQARSDYAAWFKLRAEHLQLYGAPGYDHMKIGVNLARACRSIGDYETASALAAVIAEAASSPNPVCYPANAIRLLLQFGMRSEAENVAIRHLRERYISNANLFALFPGEEQEMAAAIDFLRDLFPDADGPLLWKRLQELRNPNDSASLASFPTKTLLDHIAAIEKLLEPRSDQIRFLAQVVARRKEFAAAINILENEIRNADAVPPGDEPPEYYRQIAALRLAGEIHGEAGDWRAAAVAYDRAWRRNRAKSAPLYLKGRALIRAGDQAEGARLMKAASLIPLADSDLRGEFAGELNELGYAEIAVDEYTIVACIGPYTAQQSYLTEAAQLAAARIGKSDPLRASRLLRYVTIDCLGANAGVTDLETACPTLVRELRSFRAAAMLRAKRFDAALVETERAQDAQPMNAEPFEALLAEFDCAGRRDDADRIFRTTYDRLAAIARDYPRSAEFRNKAAWFAARCGRRLDDAQQLAQEAIRLRPDTPAYLDTLAEVHFRRGDRAAAVRYSEQAVKLAPQDEELKKQLRRFSTEPQDPTPERR